MMKSKILLMIGVAALMFTACKKDPAENVYLQKMTMESIVAGRPNVITANYRSEEHTSELQSR